jgi:hypothetical protein
LKCTLRTIGATRPRPSRTILGPSLLPHGLDARAPWLPFSLALSALRVLSVPLLWIDRRQRSREGRARAPAQLGFEHGLQGGCAKRRGRRDYQRDEPEGGHGSRRARDPLAMPQLACSRLVDRYDGGVSVVTLWSRRWLGAVLLAGAAPALRDTAQGPPGHGGGASAASPRRRRKRRLPRRRRKRRFPRRRRKRRLDPHNAPTVNGWTS